MAPGPLKQLQVVSLLLAGALSGALMMKFLPKLADSRRAILTRMAQGHDSALTLARATPSIDSEPSARTATEMATPSPQVKPATPRRPPPVTTTRKTETTRRPKAASVARSHPLSRPFALLSLLPPAQAFDDSGQVHRTPRAHPFRLPDS